MNKEELEQLLKFQTLSLVPEIPLYMGERMVALWSYFDPTMQSPPPYWAFAWAGGQALARYTLDNPAQFRGKTVLEIGPGTGLNAIAAAISGATVLTVDNVENSINLTDLNVGLHALDRWIAADTVIQDNWFEHTDILLLGDVYYDMDVAEFCNEVADKALANNVTVLVGDPEREFFPRRRCTKLASYVVQDQLNLERRPAVPAFVWQLGPR